MGLFFQSFGACLVYGFVFTAVNGKGLLARPNGVPEPQWGIGTFLVPGIAALFLSGLIGGLSKGCS